MRIIFLMILLCSAGMADSQGLSASVSQLYFGSVNEINADSLPLTLINNSGQNITVTGYRFYNTYGIPAFSTVAGNISVPANGSQQIFIRFNPRHNIFHNSELIILNDGHEGAVRIDLHGQGHYSNAYYDSSENLSEEQLKLELQSITGTNYRSLGYNVARDTMFMLIDNKLTNGQGATQNTIECVYTGRIAAGYLDRTDCQTTFNFNTEHTFPQGFFGSIEPMRSDMYHLFPTDDAANNARGSLPFAIVTNPSYQQGGSKGDNNKFEPRDAHKGHVARAMLYFLTRYQNYSSFVTAPDEAILKQWNGQFPVDPAEAVRNADINLYQHNRNPFIDYPQFAERITTFISTSSEPAFYSFDLPEDTVNYGLINAASAHQYAFWIVNDGNQPIDLSNFSLTSPLLSFVNSTGINVTVNPGESVEESILLSDTLPGIFNAYFNFNSSTSPAPIIIPVTAQLSLTGLQAFQAENYSVYPNPFTDHFTYTGPAIHDAVLMDITGRVSRTYSLLNNGDNDLDFLVPGIYFINGIADNKFIHIRLVKSIR